MSIYGLCILVPASYGWMIWVGTAVRVDMRYFIAQMYACQVSLAKAGLGDCNLNGPWNSDALSPGQTGP